MRIVHDFEASCAGCNQLLIPVTSGDLDEILPRVEGANLAHLETCTASTVKKLAMSIYNKITGPRIWINGKKAKIEFTGGK